MEGFSSHDVDFLSWRFHDPFDVRRLLKASGISLGEQPVWTPEVNPISYWRQIGQLVEDGKIPGGRGRVMAEADKILSSMHRDRSPEREVEDALERIAAIARDQWRDERNRMLPNAPREIRVSWVRAPDNLRRNQADRPRGGKKRRGSQGFDLSGRGNGILDTYRKVRSRRLVILGREGSGKKQIGAASAWSCGPAAREMQPALFSANRPDRC